IFAGFVFLSVLFFIRPDNPQRVPGVLGYGLFALSIMALVLGHSRPALIALLLPLLIYCAYVLQSDGKSVGNLGRWLGSVVVAGGALISFAIFLKARVLSTTFGVEAGHIVEQLTSAKAGAENLSFWNIILGGDGGEPLALALKYLRAHKMFGIGLGMFAAKSG